MSSLNVADYKYIDIKIKDLVNGYIRGIQEILSNDTYHNIPPLINTICALFYNLADEWSRNDVASQYEINGNKLKISNESAKGVHHQSAYLTNTVHSGKHHWRFKLSVYKGSFYVVIGIIKDTAERMVDKLLGQKANTAYAMDVAYNEINNHKSDNQWQKGNAVQCKEGDIIDMYLDLDKLELSFGVNDKHYGKTHDIDGDCGYSAGVTFKTNGNEIEFITYDNRWFE